MPHLIRLVHGNTASLKKLIREFRFFWSKHLQKGETSTEETAVKEAKVSEADTSMEVDSAENKTGEERVAAGSADDPVKPVSTDTDEIDGASAISKRQLDIKIRELAVYKKRESFRFKCWYISDAALDKYGLKDLPVPTQWEWLTKPALKEEAVADPAASTPAGKKQSKDSANHATPNNPSIKQFAVPGLIHAHTPEAQKVSTPKSKTVTPSPSPHTNSSKKTPKRITPITLFCAKQPSGPITLKETALKETSCNANVSKAGSLVGEKPVPVIDTTAKKPIVVEDDDDCMIVDEAFVPPPPSKSQPTLLAMFPPKATA